jgi:hypothetical protein
VKQFCDRYGITTDWLYRGTVVGIDSSLADILWKSEQAALQKDVEAARDLHVKPEPPPNPRPKRRAAGCIVPMARVRGR